MIAPRALIILVGALLLGSCARAPVDPVRAEALARVNELTAAMADAPRNADLSLQLAMVQIELGNGAAAEAALTRAANLGIPDKRLRPFAARAVMMQGDNARAIELIEAGDVDPDVAGEAGHVAGILYLAAGNFDAARAGFDTAIGAKPRDAMLWVDVARFRNANADAAGARDAVDFAIELDPQNAAALAAKANLVRTEQGLAAALPWYEQALAINPDAVPALLDHAATLGDLGQYRKMLEQLRRAAKLAPKLPEPYYLQAVLAARAGKYALARSLLQRTAGKMDEVPGFLLLSAIVELELDGAAVAADHAERLLRMQPENMTARRIFVAASWASGDSDGAAEALAPIVDRNDADSWSLLMAARLAAAVGDDEAAAGFSNLAARLTRGDAAAFAEQDVYGLLASAADAAPLNPYAVIPAIRAAMNRGDNGAAMARAARLLDANRGVADAQILFGDTALAARQWRLAVAAFRDARALNAGSRAALRLANAQHLAGDPAGAAATILALQEAQGDSIVADRLSGHLAMDLRQWDNGLGWFDRVRQRIGNRDVVVLREMARAYAGRGDHANADMLAMLAVRLQPLNRDLLLLWAEQKAALGKPQDAADLRDRAASIG